VRADGPPGQCDAPLLHPERLTVLV
jgi:hypothetical protein